MKLRTMFATMTAIMICLTSAKMLTKTDFKGIWIIDKDKTDFGKTDEKQTARLIIIDQENESLILSRTLVDNAPTIEKYNFDGTIVDTTMGVYKKSSSFKWSDDGKQFIISSLYIVTQEGRDPWKYDRTEVYFLSADGKTLTLDRVSVLPDRTETIKAVYDKK